MREGYPGVEPIGFRTGPACARAADAMVRDELYYELPAQPGEAIPAFLNAAHLEKVWRLCCAAFCTFALCFGASVQDEDDRSFHHRWLN